MADFNFEYHGSIVLCCPMNKEAREHLQEHVSPEAIWWGVELMVEPRYASDLAAQLEDAGYTTEL